MLFLPLVSSNLLAGIMWATYATFYEDNAMVGSVFFQLQVYVETVLLVGLFGMIYSLLVTPILFWPAFLLAEKFNMLNFLSVSAGAIFMATTPVLWFINGFSFSNPTTQSRLGITISLSICGLVAATMFWRKNFKSKNNT